MLRQQEAHKSELLSLMACLGFVLAWLLPNHYFPWPSFYSDALAVLALLAVMGDTLIASPRPMLPLASMFVFATAAIPLVQWACGLIKFGGDALMACLYVVVFGAAITVGRNRSDFVLRLLPWAVLLSAIASVALALCQWLSIDGLGIFLVDLPPNKRPFANLAQPNLLATLLVLGMVSAGLLYEQRRLGGLGASVSFGFLAWGVAMSQSRAAWLEIAVLTGWLLLVRQRASMRTTRAAVVAGALFFVACVMLWPIACDILYLSAGRSWQDQTTGGVRWTHWATLLDAVWREPFTGYGWNQASIAQARAAMSHPTSQDMIEHSHNLVIDLLVWNGVILGLALSGAIAFWIARRALACRDPVVALLLAGIGAVLAHSLLEYPIEYAFFMVPVGLMAGAVEALQGNARFVTVPRLAMGASIAAGVVMLAALTHEYLQVEDNYRHLRFESARIGKAAAEKLDAPDVVLLSQLREFLRFARTEARRGMTPQELAWMRDVSQRYGYPPVLFRYAMAAALNGQPQVAGETLAILCKVHLEERCVEGLRAWELASRQEYPELKLVSLPAYSDADAR